MKTKNRKSNLRPSGSGWGVFRHIPIVNHCLGGLSIGEDHENTIVALDH